MSQLIALRVPSRWGMELMTVTWPLLLGGLLFALLGGFALWRTGLVRAIFHGAGLVLYGKKAADALYTKSNIRWGGAGLLGFGIVLAIGSFFVER